MEVTKIIFNVCIASALLSGLIFLAYILFLDTYRNAKNNTLVWPKSISGLRKAELDPENSNISGKLRLVRLLLICFVILICVSLISFSTLCVYIISNSK